MANLRQAFLTAAWRGLKGMVIGAATAVAILAAIVGLTLGMRLLTDDYPTYEMKDDLRMILPGTAPIGVLIGSVAGLSARLPRKGLGVFSSIAIVGGCVVLAGWLIVLGLLPSIELCKRPCVPIIIAASLGGVISLVYAPVLEARYVRSVFRWIGITSIGALLVWVCMQHDHGGMKYAYIPLPSLAIGVCLAACAAFLCKRYWLTVAGPLVAGLGGVFGIGHPYGVVLGVAVGLLVILLPLGKPTKPKQDLSPPSTPG
jgi:hypothetical protein